MPLGVNGSLFSEPYEDSAKCVRQFDEGVEFAGAAQGSYLS